MHLYLYVFSSKILLINYTVQFENTSKHTISFHFKLMHFWSYNQNRSLKYELFHIYFTSFENKISKYLFNGAVFQYEWVMHKM